MPAKDESKKPTSKSTPSNGKENGKRSTSKDSTPKKKPAPKKTQGKSSGKPSGQSKKPSKSQATSKKAYSLTGELTITTSAIPPVKSSEKAFKTPGILVDEKGTMFHKTSLELMIDNRRQIAILDAEQVEILLKLIRVAEYAE